MGGWVSDKGHHPAHPVSMAIWTASEPTCDVVLMTRSDRIIAGPRKAAVLLLLQFLCFFSQPDPSWDMILTNLQLWTWNSFVCHDVLFTPPLDGEGVAAHAALCMLCWLEISDISSTADITDFKPIKKKRRLEQTALKSQHQFISSYKWCSLRPKVAVTSYSTLRSGCFVYTLQCRLVSLEAVISLYKATGSADKTAQRDTLYVTTAQPCGDESGLLY